MDAAAGRVKDEREFARIAVRLPVLVQPVDAERAAALGEELRLRPSVWAPTHESALRDLAASAQEAHEALLAEAILELTEQVVRLRSQVLDPPGPARRATIVQISGGGGQLDCQPPFDLNETFELRLDDDDLPPIRGVCRVVHRAPKGGVLGFRFDGIHTRDQDRLIRLIYRLQRQSLRHDRDDSDE